MPQGATPAGRMSGPVHPPANGGAARQVVVFLHGYGADGNDLIGLAPFFAQALPEAAFHAPDAPEPCEMNPFGRQWFSLMRYDPEMLRRNPHTMGPVLQTMLDGAKRAAPLLDAYLDGLLDHYGLTPDRLAVVGFSQGTMMALHVTPRRTDPIGALVGYSGALLGPESLADETRSRPPVLLVHGEMDPVVPFEATGLAERALKAAGFDVTGHARPGLAHGIDEEGAKLGRDFLARNLARHPA